MSTAISAPATVRPWSDLLGKLKPLYFTRVTKKHSDSKQYATSLQFRKIYSEIRGKNCVLHTSILAKAIKFNLLVLPIDLSSPSPEPF